MPKENPSEFWSGPKGKALVVAGGIIFLILVIWKMWPSNPATDANKRIFIDAETGKPFKVSLQPGMIIPVKAPSGKEAGYPAELCYWNKDGSVRKDPFPVLLKKAVDPAAGPTFCPDCGRLVVGHNPVPEPGMNPPPTEEEYKARRGN